MGFRKTRRDPGVDDLVRQRLYGDFSPAATALLTFAAADDLSAVVASPVAIARPLAQDVTNLNEVSDPEDDTDLHHASDLSGYETDSGAVVASAVVPIVAAPLVNGFVPNHVAVFAFPAEATEAEPTAVPVPELLVDQPPVQVTAWLPAPKTSFGHELVHPVTVLQVKGLVARGTPPDARLDVEIGEGELVIMEGETRWIQPAWRTMAGLDDPAAGEVILGGQHQSTLSFSERATYRVVAPGVLLDPAVLEPSFSVLENLISALMLTGQSPAECEQAGHWALARLNIENIAHASPVHLNERQKGLAMMARAIVGDPFVLWIDSPVERFGPAGGGAILDAAERLRFLEGYAVVLIGEPGGFDDVDGRRLLATAEGVRVRA